MCIFKIHELPCIVQNSVSQDFSQDALLQTANKQNELICRLNPLYSKQLVYQLYQKLVAYGYKYPKTVSYFITHFRDKNTCIIYYTQQICFIVKMSAKERVNFHYVLSESIIQTIIRHYISSPKVEYLIKLIRKYKDASTYHTEDLS